MKKTFSHRVMVVGLIVSLIANPAWAMLNVTVNPASNSSRTPTQNVLGHGTITTYFGDSVDNYSWKFGFGVKTMGQWDPQLEGPIGTVNASSWAHTLVNPPWNVSGMNGTSADHFARVTTTWLLGGPDGAEVVYETTGHIVTN